MTIYKEFVERYIDDIMEMSLLGCRGGLYNHVIESEDGSINEDFFYKFIMFLHRDSGYHDNFSRREEQKLLDNKEKLAKEVIKALKSDKWSRSDKEHYLTVEPEIINNMISSCNKIISKSLQGKTLDSLS